MKKVIALLLMIGMMLSCSVMTASASVEVSDDLLNAINDDRDNFFEKEDIIMDYEKPLTQDKSVVRYLIRPISYSCEVAIQRVGMYKFVVPQRPLPKIFTNGIVYEVQEAYYSGILTESDLEIISTFDTSEVGFLLEKAGLLNGDVDPDYRLNIVDATSIQMHLAGIKEKLRCFDPDVADFDGDSKISVLDATAIQYKLAGLEY